MPPEPRDSLTNSIGMKLVLVRPGVFLMGSPQNGLERGRDEFQHEVEITRPFHVGIHEVTQEQYQRVAGHNPSYFSPTGDGKDEIGNQDTRQFPVEYVSWEEAVRFCRLLSELPEEKAQNHIYRLPTEAEWEYVCRGGPFSPKPSLPFYVGNSLSPTQANFDGNHPYGGAEKGDNFKRTTRAGSYLPNRLRVHDLHGNVREWCADWYDADYYERSPRQDPQGPENGERRVLRGGAWFSSGFDCRTAYRNFDLPSDRNSNIGFRVVLDSGARN